MRRNYVGIWIIVSSIAFVVLYSGCHLHRENDNLEDANILPSVRVRFGALPESVSGPRDNPITQAKVDLGKLLFYDPILSGDQDVACATCHHPSSGYAETLKISIGVNGKGFGSERAFRQPNEIPFTRRNSQSILNTAFNGVDIYGDYVSEEAPMFWDLRSSSLEKQALEPIKALEEMRGTAFHDTNILQEVINRIQSIPVYQRLFSKAFPGDNPVSETNLSRAIAAFERTLITPNSRFDQYMRGDKTALSISEIEGFEAFKNAGCGNCHNGPMFSDFKTHVLGVPTSTLLGEKDRGFDDDFAFRTPTLRNLRFTFPYMHNGEISSLKKVLEFYEDISQGKSRHDSVPGEKLDPFVKALKVDVGNMDQIVNFLHCLNDEGFDKDIPASVPSGLPVGGEISNEL